MRKSGKKKRKEGEGGGEEEAAAAANSPNTVKNRGETAIGRPELIWGTRRFSIG